LKCESHSCIFYRCVVKYLHDLYSHFSIQMLAFLVEVLEKGSPACQVITVWPYRSLPKVPFSHSVIGARYDHHPLSAALRRHASGHATGQRGPSSHRGQVRRDATLEGGIEDPQAGSHQELHVGGARLGRCGLQRRLHFSGAFCHLGRALPGALLLGGRTLGGICGRTAAAGWRIWRHGPLLQEGVAGAHNGVHVRPLADAHHRPKGRQSTTVFWCSGHRGRRSGQPQKRLVFQSVPLRSDAVRCQYGDSIHSGRHLQHPRGRPLFLNFRGNFSGRLPLVLLCPGWSNGTPGETAGQEGARLLARARSWLTGRHHSVFGCLRRRIGQPAQVRELHRRLRFCDGSGLGPSRRRDTSRFRLEEALALTSNEKEEVFSHNEHLAPTGDRSRASRQLVELLRPTRGSAQEPLGECSHDKRQSDHIF